jgi:murein endopeptidase
MDVRSAATTSGGTARLAVQVRDPILVVQRTWGIRVRTIAVAFAFACVLAAPSAAFVDSGSGCPEPVEPTPAVEPIAWRESVAVGTPSAGRLVRGVRLPAERAEFFTWDPVERRRPNRAWRRWGTDRLVRIVLRVVREYAAAHPNAPRVGIGDLSRPRGGSFGPKHASHQNGLDIDVYYPRLDRRERPPRRVEQINRRLAQDLVDRFVRAGAEIVYVGPLTGFTGPPSVVQVLWNHDNHLHARFTAKTD